MAFLTDIQGEENVVVLETSHQYKQLMAYGIFKGTKLRMIRNDKWQEIILVEIDGKRVAIRKEDAEPIKVQRIDGK